MDGIKNEKRKRKKESSTGILYYLYKIGMLFEKEKWMDLYLHLLYVQSNA